MLIRVVVVSAFFALSLSSRPALAQDESHYFENLQAKLAKKIAKRAINRWRRGVVLGPAIGVAPMIADGADTVALRAEVGLALLRYDVPVLPSVGSLADALLSRAQKLFVEALTKEGMKGNIMSSEERRKLADEIWQELVDEVTMKLRPQRFETPSWALRTSVRYLGLDTASYEYGVSAGYGVGPVYLSLGQSYQFNNGRGFNTALEISVPMTLSREARSSSAEFFARVSGATRGSGRTRYMVGARYVLDVI